jgi:hypothetical protein
VRPEGAAVSPRLGFATPGLSEPACAVYDWDLLEKVWQHSFDTQLGLDMSQHPVISVDQAFSPRASQDHTAELLFESVGVPAMYLGKSAVLSILAAGKSTGMVVESGGGVSSATAVVDGVVVNRGWHYSALSGDSVSDHLYDLIQTGRNSTLKQLPSLNPLHCAGGPKAGGAGDVFASYTRHMSGRWCARSRRPSASCRRP